MKAFLLFALMFLLCPIKVFALGASLDACGNSPELATLNSEVHFQRDAPVGTESEFLSQDMVSALSCGLIDSDSGTDRDVWYRFTVPGQAVSGFDGVFSTNLAGVGIKFYYFIDSFHGFTTCNNDNSETFLHNNNTAVGVKCHWYRQTASSFLQVRIRAKLVKVAETVESGELLTVPSTIQVTLNYNNVSDTKDMADISLNANVPVRADKCTLNSNVMSFDMGDVPAGNFSGGTGYSPANNDLQNLSLSCDANANINITLDGIQNPDVSDTSILALSSQGQNGVADGVGVQLIYNGTPLELNKLINLKLSSGGMESFPITARYIQTKNVVTAGSANAIATLNVTYQ